MGVTTIARNALRPGYFTEMARKVYLAVRDGEREREAGRRWAERHVEDLDAWCRERDPDLWAESLDFAERMRADAQPRADALRSSGIHVGGGACYPLLHFLVRRHRPRVVLETGVGAGWSSRAMLSALAENGGGHLYSSDFPAFRMADPEQYIGCLVPAHLRPLWTLHVRGDRRNLGPILATGARPQLLHYDSDKRRGSRAEFLRRVGPYLAPNAVVVMDDVNDDLFFADYTAGRGDMAVFRFENKYLGVLGA
jgi:predicted O-methyltransferase YrrM